jgi:hypothetical protein
LSEGDIDIDIIAELPILKLGVNNPTAELEVTTGETVVAVVELLV